MFYLLWELKRQGVHFCFWISLPLTNEFEVHTVSWIYGPNTQAVGHKSEQEKQASIMYSMDQDSRLVRYLFYRWVQMEGGDFNLLKLLNLVGHTLKYGLLNWPIIVRVLTEWYNSCPYYFFHKISLLKNHPGYLKVLDFHVSVSRECLVSCSLHSNCLVILLKNQMLYFTLVCLQWVLCAILFLTYL